MTAVDWTGLAWGALGGATAAALFFSGLAWGLRIALRRARPGPVLFASAVVRIGALLAAVWLVAGQGAWVLGGFGLGFVLMRLAVVTLARPPARTGAGPAGGKPCN